MSELHGAAVTDENGQILNNDELADLLSTADKVEFWFEKMRRGKVVKRAKLVIDVDTDGIDAADIATYRRDVSQNAVAQEELREEAQKLGFLDADGKETDHKSPDKPRLTARLSELATEFNQIVANLVCKMVMSEPIAGKDLRDPVVLCERDGIGPVAREALYTHFFGDFEEPEVETGTSAIAIIENASDILEAAVIEADVQPIS